MAGELHADATAAVMADSMSDKKHGLDGAIHCPCLAQEMKSPLAYDGRNVWAQHETVQGISSAGSIDDCGTAQLPHEQTMRTTMSSMDISTDSKVVARGIAVYGAGTALAHWFSLHASESIGVHLVRAMAGEVACDVRFTLPLARGEKTAPP